MSATEWSRYWVEISLNEVQFRLKYLAQPVVPPNFPKHVRKARSKKMGWDLYPWSLDSLWEHASKSGDDPRKLTGGPQQGP